MSVSKFQTKMHLSINYVMYNASPKKRMLLILRENAQVHYGVLSTYHSNYDINAKVDQFI